MAHFDPRVITVNPRSAGRPILIGIGLIFLLIILWASVAYVPPGSVGVLTFFGRVTGEVLPEGTHFVSPFKITTGCRSARSRRGAHLHPVERRLEPGD